MSKIGTGEGAQAYGHGMYLAENEGVARGYRDTLAGKNQKLEWNGQPVEGRAVNSLVDSLQDQDWRLARIVDQAGKWGPRNAIDTFEPHTRNASDGPAWQAAMDQFKEGVGNSATGHMYEVNVNADPERFLHWDKPLSEQHPDVIKALNNTPYPPRDMRMSVKDYMAELETNREMASKMGDPAAMASQALQEAGIPGIRYLDQGSRGAGEGSHNYVVFDANSMDIIRRYGLAGLMAGASGYGASLSGRSSEAATQQRQPNALQAP
jgi:hypothetical protein